MFSRGFAHLTLLDKISLVFGQMNEPQGSRLRVALSGLTLPEKFRDDATAEAFACGSASNLSSRALKYPSNEVLL